MLHVGRVYRNVVNILETRAMSRPELPPKPGRDVDPIGYLADALDDLVTALTEIDPAAPVWNWSDQPQVAAFWPRRMAHESAVHRYDAQSAHGMCERIDVDLATDGIDELLGTILPMQLRTPVDGLDGTMRLQATDADATWLVQLTPGAATVSHGSGTADVSLSGPAYSLELVLYNRVDLDTVDVSGDPRLLEVWRERVRF